MPRVVGVGVLASAFAPLVALLAVLNLNDLGWISWVGSSWWTRPADGRRRTPRRCCHIAQGYMPPARPFDDQRRDEIEDAKTAGWLVERGDGELAPNDDLVVVETALARVTRLHEFLNFPDDAFRAWFRRTFGMSPDLEKELVWDEVFR